MKCGRQSNLVSTTTIFRASTKFKNGIPTFLKFNADTAVVVNYSLIQKKIAFT